MCAESYDPATKTAALNFGSRLLLENKIMLVTLKEAPNTVCTLLLLLLLFLLLLLIYFYYQVIAAGEAEPWDKINKLVLKSNLLNHETGFDVPKCVSIDEDFTVIEPQNVRINECKHFMLYSYTHNHTHPHIIGRVHAISQANDWSLRHWQCLGSLRSIYR